MTTKLSDEELEAKILQLPNSKQLKKMKHKLQVRSSEWAFEVGVLMGYKGTRRYVMDKVYQALYLIRGEEIFIRTVDMMRWYLENKGESKRKLLEIIRSKPDAFKV